MANNEAILEIAVETRDAIKDIQKFQKKSKDSLKSVQSSFNLIKVAAGAAVAAFASAKLIGGLKSVTEAASVQEDAINSLNSAMQISGDFSEEASQGMQDYASAIQETTKFGDEAILQTLALAKAYGATNEQAKLVASAATEFAAASGKSLQTATEQISKSLGGFAGELGEINPAIKALTKEQLAAGGAAKILIAQYGGSAAAQVNTFSGALQQTSNTFGDLQEEIGFLITKNPVVIKGVKLIGAAFGKMIESISGNKGAIGAFIVESFKKIVSFIPKIVGSLSFVIEAFRGIALIASTVVLVVSDVIKAFLEFEVVQDIINLATKAFKGLGIAAAAVFSGLLEGLKLVGVDVGDFQAKIDDMGAALLETFDEKADTSGAVENLGKLSTAAVDFAESSEESFGGFQKALTFVKESTQEVADEVNKLEFENIVGPEIQATVNGAVGKSFFTKLNDQFLEFVSSLNLGEVGVGAVNTILKGAEGAKAAVAKGAESLAVVLGASGPLGAGIGAVVGELSKGPDHIKQMVRGFVDALPAVLDALIAAMPVLVDELIKALPQIINALVAAVPVLIRTLVDALPTIIQSLVDALPEVIDAVIENIPPIIVAIIEAIPDIIQAIVEAAPAIIEALALAIPQIAKAMALTIPQAVVEGIGRQVFGLQFDGAKLTKILNDIGTQFKDFFTGIAQIPKDFLMQLEAGLKNIVDQLNPSKALGGGGGGGAVGQVKKVFGLAEGGTVPSGFNDDTFPASLTSGELVVPRDDVSKLRSFLNTQSGGADSGVNGALLAQIADLLAQPIQVSSIAEVDGEAFANVMLNLSRQNARTA